MTRNVHVVDHPLVQHKLTLMRDKDASHSRFRALASELGALLAYEMTRNIPTVDVRVQTPLGEADGVRFDLGRLEAQRDELEDAMRELRDLMDAAEAHLNKRGAEAAE